MPALVLDVLFSVLLVGMMLLYSVKLTLIVLVSMPLYLGPSLAMVHPARAESSSMQTEAAGS